MEGNGWEEWKNHVLQEQKRQNRVMENIREDVSSLKGSLLEFKKDAAVESKKIETELRIKSGIWGAVAGLIPAALAVIYIFMRVL